jgi:glucose-6-phosphate isomerase
MPTSLRFYPENASADRLGPQQGLDLKKLLASNEAFMDQSLKNLFATSQEAGGWKRWVDLGTNPDLVSSLKAYAATAKDQFDDLVILGIGGSSLGGLALLKALLHPYWNQLSKEQRQGFPRFHFIDNVDADCVRGLFDTLTPERTLINVISKSGTTAESMAAFLYAKARLEAVTPTETVMKRHMVFTTDRNKGILRDIAKQFDVTCFEVPDDVGGRFSIFSAVGLLPAILCGVDIEAMLQGVREMKVFLEKEPVATNPVVLSTLIQIESYRQGRPISVLMPYSTRLAFVADWYVQLWAESLGKAKTRQGETVHVGATPVKAVGATDQHSQIQLYNEGPFDKIVTFIQVEAPSEETLIPQPLGGIEELAYLGNQGFHRLLTAEFEATRASLTSNQRPNVTLALPSITPYTFAQLLYFFEVQTALAGDLLSIDPFDQPGVELAKKYTYALMGRTGYEALIPEAKGERLATSAH